MHNRALHNPDQKAFTFLQDGETESDSLTYKQLEQQAQAIASQLQSLGFTGERALLLYSPGLEFIVAFFGCLYAGVIGVPAYPPRSNQKMTRLSAIVADASAKVALTTNSLLKDIKNRFAQDSELSILNTLATDNIDSNQAHKWEKPQVNSDTLVVCQGKFAKLNLDINVAFFYVHPWF
ncbi:AMP-binding protein [Nostoc sp. UHCC 0302]|uniref:AMP-binding protein n=1 Tax=Nostoc sp. UHCC 0302 TaxID=3134896 RepID=UPI00311CE009